MCFRAFVSAFALASTLGACALEEGGTEETGAEASENGTSADDGSDAMTDSGGEPAHPYGPCNDACDTTEFECGFCLNCGPMHAGGYETCSWLCDVSEDCPAAPSGHAGICVGGGCMIPCVDDQCPDDGSVCMDFLFDSPPVCMFER